MLRVQTETKWHYTKTEHLVMNKMDYRNSIEHVYRRMINIALNPIKAIYIYSLL